MHDLFVELPTHAAPINTMRLCRAQIMCVKIMSNFQARLHGEMKLY